MVSKKHTTTNNYNNTKCTRNSGNCQNFSSLCIDRFPSAPAHRARAITTYLNANNENAVDFPPKWADLNIIENIWDELNRRVRRTGAIPTTLNQLREKILHEWNNLPQNYVERYETSMRRRCLAVVNSAGDIPATKFTWTWTPLRDLT